jgi:hypothetical protein
MKLHEESSRALANPIYWFVGRRKWYDYYHKNNETGFFYLAGEGI